MTEISTLYGHLKTLTKQWFYEKSEIDTALAGKADTSDIPDVSDVIRTSSTAGLVKNDGTIDTTTYQAAGNYIETSATAGLVKNDGTIDTNTYLTQHQDISGKANVADLATVATSGDYSDLQNIPSTFAPTAHEHSAADVKDASAYSNLGTSANATQHAINTAIDTKIGSLLSVELITVASTLPTASASTMNKLYLVPETSAQTHDAYEVYVTVEEDDEGTPTYSWEKIDTARIDLSNYVTTNDSRLSDARTPLSHTHGDITNDGKIGSASGKVLVTTTGGAITTSDMVTEMDTVVQSLISYGTSL